MDEMTPAFDEKKFPDYCGKAKTLIRLDGGGYLHVRETYDEIKDLIKTAKDESLSNFNNVLSGIIKTLDTKD